MKHRCESDSHAQESARLPLGAWLFAVMMMVQSLEVFLPSTSWAQATVSLRRTGERWQLFRNGEPYAIRGVGGKTRLDVLQASGGNSIRTWSVDGLEPLLDAAAERGLAVCVGLWIGHERHGFDYQNQAAVVEQLEQSLAAVKKYKDHPAVLMWAVGNEAEGDGKNPAIWYAINHIAREIQRLDPHHPTMTVIAELGEGESKLANIQRFCPDIDIVGVNTYGGISTVAQRYRQANISKPYVVTEHGPHGPWEVKKTAWGAPLEPTSTQKAASYAQGYQVAVTDQPGLCLGSYAFLWGHKQETTATWFGMLLPDGSRLQAVDVMTRAWSGRPPENRCPQIQSLQLAGSPQVKPGAMLKFSLEASDPESDTLDVEWVLRHDSVTIGVGGDAQADERVYADLVKSQGNAAIVTAPKGGGGYRLFAYVRDGQGGGAVANVPFHVDAPVLTIEAPVAKMPFVVYSDEAAQKTYVPSGYMGNAKAVRMTLDSKESPRAGDTCLKVEYAANDQWGGVLWQSPPDDWTGERPGGLNLSNANSLEFWARGAAGGEKVSFLVGAIEGDKPYRDSDKIELKDAQLTNEWQRFRIPLNGRNLKRIKTGFGWSLPGQGKPVVFYLDDIRYLRE